MYLLDTNICIFSIKQMNQHLLKKLRKKSKKIIYVSALTVAELEFGVSNSQYPDKNRLALMKFLSVFDILPFNENDAISYGIIKADLRSRGQIIGPIDLLLAGQALSKDLIMITNNVNEFERVKNLKVEDWTK